MPLQDTSYHPLCTQDLPMNGDLFAPRKASVSSQSRILETGSQTTIPSLVDRAANIVSDYCYNMKPYHDNGLLHLKPLPWQAIQDASVLKQELNHHHLVHESSENHFENALGGTYTEKPAEDSLWDYGYIHHSVPPYTSSMQPRNYPTETDVNTREPLQAHTEPHNAPSFFTDYHPQPSHQIMIANMRLQRHRDILASSSNICQINPVDEPFQNPCSSSSLYSADSANFNISPISSPGTASPDTVSPATILGQEAINSRTVYTGEESDEDGSSNSEPYAQLIFRALKSAPGHRMVLKEIYEWFAKNTDKAKTSSSKGWQNSIRHNLSMNGVRSYSDRRHNSDKR